MALPQFEDSKLKGTSEIAKTLGVLRAKRGAFTPEQLSAYTNLQNAVMGLPTQKSADEYLKELAGLLETTPETKAPETTPEAANQNMSAEEVATPDSAPVEVPAKETESTSGLRFIERDRMGISFGVSKPEVPAAGAETPAPVAVNENTPEAVTPEPIQEVVPPAEPAEAVVSEPVEPAIVAPAQSPEPAKVLTEIERPSDIEAIAKEVGIINESLNVFAHGRAFQWLRNPDTGYREYMTKLIAMREAIDSARKGKGSADLKAMMEELRTLGENVRHAVGEESESHTQSAPEVAVAPAAEATVEAAVAPQATAPETEPSPAMTAAQETRDLPSSEETPAPVAESSNETVIPIQTVASTMPEAAPQTAAEPLNIYEQPRVDTEVSQTEAESPIAEVPQEVPAQTDIPVEEHGGVDAGIQDASEAIEESAYAPVTPDAPLPNPEIYAPQVTQALNDLLTEWLGHTGWILRKSGLDHPDWHKMAPLTVGQIMEAEKAKTSKEIGGLELATIDNLAQNLRKWGQLYGISMLQHEDTTIEEIMRRIVFESLKQ